MPNPVNKYRVVLEPELRQHLESICRKQSVGAAKMRRARILLMADEGHPEGRRSDREIGESVGLCERQVVRIRQRYVCEGDRALERRPRPSAAGKLDGAAEAHLVTLCCSAPPTGRDHWTLQLLCDELARLQVVEYVCPETVRKCLKKTRSNRGERNASVFPKAIARGSWPVWRQFSTRTKKSTTRDTR